MLLFLCLGKVIRCTIILNCNIKTLLKRYENDVYHGERSFDDKSTQYSSGIIKDS